MGLCDCKSKSEPGVGQKPEINEFDQEIINQKFNEYISRDDIKDFVEKNYNLKDPVFQLIRENEIKRIKMFYQSKKEEFHTNMNSYLNGQNLHFIPMLTKQIISNEGGRETLKLKIMEKIQEIYNNEDVHTINYLTVMIIGKTGTGKSTLVNNMLKLKGGKKAKTGWGDRITTETTIYKNKEVPYIRLVDTVGIELSGGFDAINIGIEASNFIKNQISLNNVNDLCIAFGTVFLQIDLKDLRLN